MILCPHGHTTIPVTAGGKPSPSLRFCPDCCKAFRIDACHDTEAPASEPSRKDISAGDAR